MSQLSHADCSGRYVFVPNVWANEFTQKHGRKPDLHEIAEAMDLGSESIEILKRAINASDNFSRPLKE